MGPKRCRIDRQIMGVKKRITAQTWDMQVLRALRRPPWDAILSTVFSIRMYERRMRRKSSPMVDSSTKSPNMLFILVLEQESFRISGCRQ